MAAKKPIFEDNTLYYQKACPAAVCSQSIRSGKDGEFARIAFVNICARTISELTADIKCFDANGKEIAPMIKDFAYSQSAAPSKEFGSSVKIPLAQGTALIKVNIKTIGFADGMHWQKPNRAALKAVAAQKPLSSLKDGEDGYCRALGIADDERESFGVFSQREDYWQCCCTQLNAPLLDECCKCSRKRALMENPVEAAEDASVNETPAEASEDETAAEAADEATVNEAAGEVSEQAVAEDETANEGPELEAEQPQPVYAAVGAAMPDVSQYAMPDANGNYPVSPYVGAYPAKKGKGGKTALIIIGCVVAVAALVCAWIFWLSPMIKYNKAVEYYNSGDYSVAYELFDDLENYKNSEELAQECRFMQASELLDNGEYERAYELFDDISGYKNSDELAVRCLVGEAGEYMADGDYHEALGLLNDALREAPADAEALEKYDECCYVLADEAIERQDYVTAADLLEGMAGANPDEGYKDSYYAYSYCCFFIYGEDARSLAVDSLKVCADANYRDSKALYDEFTRWELYIVINADESDNITAETSVDMNGEWFVHVNLMGGDNTYHTLHARATFPGGGEYDIDSSDVFGCEETWVIRCSTEVFVAGTFTIEVTSADGAYNFGTFESDIELR